MMDRDIEMELFVVRASNLIDLAFPKIFSRGKVPDKVSTEDKLVSPEKVAIDILMEIRKSVKMAIKKNLPRGGAKKELTKVVERYSESESKIDAYENEKDDEPNEADILTPSYIKLKTKKKILAWFDSLPTELFLKRKN